MKRNIQFLFISAFLFSFQILLSIYLSSSLAGQNIALLITPTYLGFGLALLVSSATQKMNRINDAEFSVAVILSIIFSLLIINNQIHQLNFEILEMGKAHLAEFKNFQALIKHIYSQHLFYLSMAMGLPFFIYGLYFSKLLGKLKSSNVIQLLSIELAGAIAGLLISLILINYIGWINTFLFFFYAATLVSLYAYATERKKILTGVLVVLVLVICVYQDQFIPTSNLHISARDYKSLNKIDLLAEDWNAFSKVQTLQIQPQVGFAQPIRKLISIGEGTGHADVPSAPDAKLSVTTQITQFFKPKNVLILFAGAGYELVKLSQFKNPPESVIGVEINEHVIKQGLSHSSGHLENLLQNKNYQLVKSDARQYLERNTKKYDVILFSWSGVTVNYYSGAIVHTTQYVFTREAFKAAIDALSPTGHLIIFGSSKPNLMAHLKALKIDNLKNRVILLKPNHDPTWRRNWDNHIFIFSRAGFDHSYTVKDLESLLTPFKYSIAIHPNSETDSDYFQLEQLLESEDWVGTVAQINKENTTYIKSHTDDMPFTFHTHPNLNSQEIYETFLRTIKFEFGYSPLNLIIYISIFMVVYLLCYTAIKIRSEQKFFGFFALIGFLIGTASMALMYYTNYKLVNYLGFPSLALVAGFFVSLGSSLFCLRAVASKYFNMKIFIIIQSFGIILLFALNYFFQSEGISKILFNIPVVLQVFVLVLLFLVTMVSSSFAYPYLISISLPKETLVKMIISCDVIGCALGSMLVPLLIEDFGLATTIFGAAISTLISLIFVIFIGQKLKLVTLQK